MKRVLLFLAVLLHMTTLLAVPVVTNLSTHGGPVTGGSVITIMGTGFTGTTAVTFDTIPAASFIVNSDTSITATTPPIPSNVPGTYNVLVTAGTTSAPVHNSLFAFQGAWYGYTMVPTPGSLYAPINLATNTINTLIPIGASPFQVAITPNSRIASTTLANAQLVVPLDLTSNTGGAAVFTGAGGFPTSTAITPDGSKAYVVLGGIDQVGVIDIASNTLLTTIAMPTTPRYIAITPDGTRAYVTASTTNLVYRIDIPANTVGATIAIGTNPMDIAILPDGSKAYVLLGGNPGSLVFIDLPAETVGTSFSITGSFFPEELAITPDGLKAYVLDNAARAFPIDLVNSTVGTAIGVGVNSNGIAITPDGASVYVSSFASMSVTQINVASDTGVASIGLPGNGFGIAITPDQAPLAFFTTGPANPGTPTLFNASGSVSPVGTIQSYFWDFGDGNTTTTLTPIVGHTYATLGTFTATLTVTNSAGTSTTQVFTGKTMSRNGGVNAITSQDINVVMAPAPTPVDFKGKLIKNRFLTQTDRIHHLTWSPGPDYPVEGYRLYRNGVLIALIGASGPLVYNDHNRNYPDVYTLIAFNDTGTESDPVTLVVPGPASSSSSSSSN